MNPTCTMGISLPFKTVQVLIGKVLNKTKTNIFSTVGPRGLFRPFLLLRARKTDIRREPSYMCCVQEVTSSHLGVEISVTQKVRKFKFPQLLKPHSPAWIQNNWVSHCVIMSQGTYIFQGPKTPQCLAPKLENWLITPHKYTISLSQGFKKNVFFNFNFYFVRDTEYSYLLAPSSDAHNSLAWAKARHYYVFKSNLLCG